MLLQINTLQVENESMYDKVRDDNSVLLLYFNMLEATNLVLSYLHLPSFTLQRKGLRMEMPNPCTWRERSFP